MVISISATVDINEHLGTSICAIPFASVPRGIPWADIVLSRWQTALSGRGWLLIEVRSVVAAERQQNGRSQMKRIQRQEHTTKALGEETASIWKRLNEKLEKHTSN